MKRLDSRKGMFRGFQQSSVAASSVFGIMSGRMSSFEELHMRLPSVGGREDGGGVVVVSVITDWTPKIIDTFCFTPNLNSLSSIYFVSKTRP